MIVIDVPAAPAPPPPASNPNPDSRTTRITRSSKSQSPEDPSTLQSQPSPQSQPSLSPGIGQPLVYDVPTDLPIPSFAKQSNDVERDLARVYEAISNARRIAVICGAGISVSPPANIPDFRSSTGLFKRLKEKHPSAGLTSGKDLFDARLFQSQKTSVLFHAMISELKQLADVAQPTSFHHLLKRLDVEGRLLRVYTQNIDALEERAGLTFGLGETGDRTLTKRNLVGGKRKRNLKGDAGEDQIDSNNPPIASGSGSSSNLGNRSSSWGRSKSDSALVFNKKNQNGNKNQEDQITTTKTPMFPRVVPLHGSLQTLTCGICAHKMILPDSSKISNTTTTPSNDQSSTITPIQEEEEDHDVHPGPKSKLRRRFSTSPNASERMDVVENHRDGDDSKESIMDSTFNSQSGEVLQEPGGEEEGDGPMIPTTPEKALELLAKGEPIPCPTCEVANEVRLVGGLRSRGVGLMKVDVVLYGGQNEGAERVGQCLERDVLGLRDPSEPPVPETLRERQTRERKENKDREKLRKEKLELEEKFKLDLGLKEGQELRVFGNEKDALEANFNDSDCGNNDNGTNGFPFSSQPLPNRKKASPQIGKPKLKPLPPDLLIVAGTSLKVPGTKRIVREFSKACKARDRRIYPDDEEDEDGDEGSGGDESSTNGSGSKGTRSSSRRSSRRRTETPSSVGAGEEEKDGNEDNEEDEEEDERNDPNRPIRSILLNYDFPIPAKEWDGVFDFWLRGDLQRAARGLWPDGKPIAARDPFLEAEKLAASKSALALSKIDRILEEDGEGDGELSNSHIATTTSSTTTPSTITEQQYVPETVYNYPQPPLEQSWKPLLTGLEEKRLLEKKNQRMISLSNRSKNSRSQTPSSSNQASSNLSESDFFISNSSRNSISRIGGSPLSSVTSSATASSSSASSTKAIKDGGSVSGKKASTSNSKANAKGSGKLGGKGKKNETAQAATIAGANQAIGKGKGKAKAKAKSTSSSDPTKKLIATNKVKKQTKAKVKKINRGASDEKDEEMVDELLSSSSSPSGISSSDPDLRHDSFSGIEIVVEEPSSPNTATASATTFTNLVAKKRKNSKKQTNLMVNGSGPFKSVKKVGNKSSASKSIAKGK